MSIYINRPHVSAAEGIM